MPTMPRSKANSNTPESKAATVVARDGSGDFVEFRGRLETGVIGGENAPERQWTAILLPFDPRAQWPGHGNLRVRGTINGVPIRTMLAHPRTGGYLMIVKQSLQKQARIAPGSMAEVRIEPDIDDPSAAPPVELVKLFREDREVKRWFEKLPLGMRRYICAIVAEPKSAEARRRRAEQWVECLMLTMEGEIEPPPILQAGFRRQPLAREGWEAMTPIQRRNTLIGIYMHRGPEARAKRAEQAITDALAAANRGRARGRATDDLNE